MKKLCASVPVLLCAYLCTSPYRYFMLIKDVIKRQNQ